MGVGLAVAVLAALFLSGKHSAGSSYRMWWDLLVLGWSPANATLPSTAGGFFNLGTIRGKTTLIFFQEGTDCEPCWTQLKDMQDDMSAFHAAGINDVVSINTDSLVVLKQKMSDEGIGIPVLSDTDPSVSDSYNANRYGMICKGHEAATPPT